MKKVYVLTIDDTTEDYGTSINTIVFSNLEIAKKYLEIYKTNFLCDNNIDEEESVIEDEEMSWTWYYDGEYNTNHYSLHIEEKEIL